MKFYYEITVINKDTREVKCVPISMPEHHDCNDSMNRETVVQFALNAKIITDADLPHICEVENLTTEQHTELLKYNREKS